MPTQEQILAALGRVIDPELRRPVTELDMVREVVIDGSEVSVTIALTVVGCPLRSSFEDQVAEHVGTLAGQHGVFAIVPTLLDAAQTVQELIRK